MPVRTQSDVHWLRQIRDHARALASKTRSSCTSFLSPPPRTATSPPLDLFPPAQSIITSLVSVGLHHGIAHKVSLAYGRTACKLREHYDANVRRTIQLSSRTADPRLSLGELHSKYCSTMAARYLQTLRDWRSEIIEMVKSRLHAVRPENLSNTSTRQFNQAAIPSLEKVFAENSRPSRAEKQYLADQTCMEYKQISVWFQNRRNRSKKGTPVEDRKFDSCLPPDLAAALTRILELYVFPGEGTAHDEEEHGSSDYASSFAPFHVDRPHHAFPSSYPPLCSHDPFPISSNSRRFSIAWHRTPLAPPALPRTDDESDLLTLLSKWNLGPEDELKHYGQQSDAAADAGLTVHLPPAPLPALIRDCPPPPRHCELSPLCRQHLAKATRVSSPTVPAPVSMETARKQTPEARISRSQIRGRRRARPSRPSDPRLSSSKGSDASSDECSLTSASRGRPYPKGKPSRVKRTVQSAHRTIRQTQTNMPGTTSSLCSRRSELYTPSPSPVPTALPALSRESSVSSLRSVSSTSSSASEVDLLLTPPLYSTSVLDYPVPDLLASLSDNANKYLCKGVDDTPRGAVYMSYSLACGDRDPTLDMPSALYSQFEPAVPLYSEPPPISTISPLVLVL